MHTPFDLEGYLHKLKWADNDPKVHSDPPIILRGFCRRQDGIGSHLPNLYDNVFKDYENVSFQLPSDRRGFQHGFLQDITDTSETTLKKYDADFRWIEKFRFYENRHIAELQTFKNAKVIHVSSFCGSLEREHNENFLDFYKYKKQYNAELYLYLMWESGSYEQLAPLFDIYDNVVVTNKWLHDELRNFFGDAIKVHNIEHIAKYYVKPATGSTTTFNFGFSGGLWERKKVDVIMKAFNEAKTPNDRLKIHTRKHANTATMINAFVEEFSKYQTIGQGPMEFINETLPDTEFVKWWDTLNCYVFVSAGESYSVTPRQALMQGTPVILSKNTSHLDLLDVPGILWVECDEEHTAKYSGNADLGASIGTQFEPRVNDVIECMKQVRENYSYWKDEAVKGGEIIRKRTSPKNIAKQWRQVLCK